MTMLPYNLLLPDNLTATESRILYSALTSCRVPRPAPADNPAHIVLSVGKGGLDTWHEWGLIRVGAQHGSAFVHDGTTYYVVEHPGAMLQLQFGGKTARESMARDLMHFLWLLEGRIGVERLFGKWCGACLKQKDTRQREAVKWPVSVDCVGLCDDHVRRVGRITKRPKPRLNPSSREAQLPGQREMFNGRIVAK